VRRDDLEHIANASATLALAVDRTSELIGTLRGLALDRALGTELLTFDDAGVVELSSSVPAASVAVVNMGTTPVIATSGPRSSSAPLTGVGMFVVGVGNFLCLPLAGSQHTFYGRPGELVTVVRYTCPQPPAAGTALGPAWFGVDVNAGVDNVVYATPHGLPAQYGGFSAAELTGAATAQFDVRDGALGGKLIARVHLLANESRDEVNTAELLTTPKVFFNLISGLVALKLRVH